MAQKMNIKQEIAEFDAACKPFYLVDHDNGTFSLCLAFSFLDYDYGQEAFNAYAREIGVPVRDEYGVFSYGNGYEWAAAFKEAFKNDPNLSKIQFDCEAGGFFCNSKDLAVIKNFGQRFKALVDKFGSSPAAMKQAGIAYATDQIIDLYANGIKNVHVYSMNNPDVARKIQSNLSDILG